MIRCTPIYISIAVSTIKLFSQTDVSSALCKETSIWLCVPPVKSVFCVFSAQPAGGAAAAPGAAASTAGAAAAGQQDYSAAWAEYYRQQAAYYGQGGQAPGQAAAPQQGQVVYPWRIGLGIVNIWIDLVRVWYSTLMTIVQN